MPAAKEDHAPTSNAGSDFRIAIVGGGIGGLSVALSIGTYCPGLTARNVTVYEQAPAYTEIGAGISIGISAGRVLKKLGVWEAVDAISGYRTNVHRSNRRWDTDELIVDAPAFNTGGSQEEVRQLWLHRAEFLDVLYSEVKRRNCATLETDKRVVRLEDHGSTVTLHFADGTTAAADLVIGCDGIHSAVRSQFVVDQPVYSGRIAFRGIIPMSAVADDWPYSSWTLSWLAPGKHFLAFGMSQNRLMNVVAFVAKPESELQGLKESWRSEAPREAIEKEYAGWCPTVQRIIQAMPETISQWKINDREVLSQWVYMDGKVVLSGDAAHAMLPMQGSGAGLSIEDANVLGFAVRDYLSKPGAGLDKYMLKYQTARVHRAQKAQVTSRQAAAVYDMHGPDFEGKTFEECLPVVRDKVESRMAWLWKSDLEADWAAAGEV
ncbi:Salicylate hydroxylase [Cladophialophora carrionii]|uniref:Salicylate hydroxylase n=1 Tax=Cladophialophora carrionii TaxID=86049 RepID=A0A1C1CKW8_9EURO|nr:Salicylate hydroxylase [Cladophialophora carrionii]